MTWQTILRIESTNAWRAKLNALMHEFPPAQRAAYFGHSTAVGSASYFDGRKWTGAFCDAFRQLRGPEGGTALNLVS